MKPDKDSIYDYLMYYVNIETTVGNSISGILIDIAEFEEDPTLTIDAGVGFELKLSEVKSIQVRR